MSEVETEKGLFEKFQLNGFILTREAVLLMKDEFEKGFPPYKTFDEFMTKISDVLIVQTCAESLIIDAKVAQESLKFLDEKKKYDSANGIIVKNVIFKDKDQFDWQAHYQFIIKTLYRNPLFASDEYGINKIDDLVSSKNDQEGCAVVGLLRRSLNRVSSFTLEDGTGSVPLKFSSDSTDWRDAVIAENCFVLIEGKYEAENKNSDMLVVEKIGSIPLLIRSARSLTQNLNNDQMIVMVHDIYLDSKQTRDKLKTLFIGYNSAPKVPQCFILIGNFFSKSNNIAKLKENFLYLTTLILACKNLSINSKFIFVPGPNDNVEGDFPRKPFSFDVFPSKCAKLTNFYLATNPVNIYFDSYHICIFAYPYVSKLQRHIIHDNTTNFNEFGSAIGKLLLSNAHLSAGLNKNFQSSLALSHVPDLLIVADTTLQDDFDCKIHKTSFVNLPSFSANEFKFKVHYVQTRATEDSQIQI